ncbi:MAG: hypothetical protein HGA67_03335 [Candidatus Yonathbacteria bacterium]|nr:hypothetical protein [Candidatus Yonathbacteria bacterium]
MSESITKLHTSESSLEERGEWFPEEDIAELDAIVERHSEKGGFRSYAEREDAARGIKETERCIAELSAYEETLRAFLDRYGVETTVRKIGGDVFAVETTNAARDILDELPAHFVFVGGTARAALERSLGVNKFSVPRDTDIVVMDKDADEDLMADMSERYMPDDYEHGYGVKKEDEEYFKTRDFTINEVFATKEAVYCTKQCLLDTLRGVLRFAEYEKRESWDGYPYYVHPKLLAKALRLAVSSNLSLADEGVYDMQCIDEFHMALHLDRALGQGGDVARGYVEALREKNQIPQDISTPEDLVTYLNEYTDFVFRFDEPARIEEEEKAYVFTDKGTPYEHLVPEKYAEAIKKTGMRKL